MSARFDNARVTKAIDKRKTGTIQLQVKANLSKKLAGAVFLHVAGYSLLQSISIPLRFYALENVYKWHQLIVDFDNKMICLRNDPGKTGTTALE